MTKTVTFVVQAILFAIAYELAGLPIWQYFITIGLVILACEIGRYGSY